MIRLLNLNKPMQLKLNESSLNKKPKQRLMLPLLKSNESRQSRKPKQRPMLPPLKPK